MQIQVIPNGSVRSFDMLAYPEQHPMNQQFIQQRVYALSQDLGATMTEMGQRFVERAKSLYEKAYDSKAIQAARSALRAVKGLFHPNAIVPLESIDELRGAQPAMQRYLMANPETRQMYFDQRIDGYSDSYVNVHGKTIGDDHYDYRRVQQGMVVINEDKEGEPDWVSVQYVEDLLPGDRELLMDEQIDIQRAWSWQDCYHKMLKDSTNIFGGGVGA